MTRLITEWISNIESDIQDYDDNLKKKLGMSLLELTAKTCGLTEEAFRREIQKHTVAVVPITAGEGLIGSFSESVAAIARVMGSNAFVTESTDVSGISEGILKGADILFMADDNDYVSVNVKTGAVGDNNTATARGYVTALEKMAGTLENKDTLVIGCGIVGRKAIDALKEKGAVVALYDKNMDRVKDLNCGENTVLTDVNEMKKYKYILDATNEGGWLYREMFAENAVISAPGVPLSLDDDTYETIQNRVIHDYLQIGTAVMLGLLL